MTESLAKKVDFGIRLIQSASKIAADNGTPALEVAYSGGKDSDCLLRLTQMAGVPYRAIYKNTTIDPPGTIQHAIQNGCEIMRPEWTFAHLMQLHGIPSRFVRFCCKKLKEYKILDYALIGVRRSESTRRAKMYKEPEQCRVYSAKEKVRAYYPLLEWTSDDVAEFVKADNIQCHSLYYDDDGSFHVERRLGCLCCPLANRKKRIEQFCQHPRMVAFWLRNIQIWKDLHPSDKQVGDVYENFARNLFFISTAEYRAAATGWFAITDWKQETERRLDFELPLIEPNTLKPAKQVTDYIANRAYSRAH
jgi:phosphoadenosine phosphosulfate reductase